MTNFHSDPFRSGPTAGGQMPPMAGLFFGPSASATPPPVEEVVDQLMKGLFGTKTTASKADAMKAVRLPLRVTQGDDLLTIEYLLPGLKREALSIQVEPTHLTVTVKEETSSSEEQEESSEDTPQAKVLRDDLSAYSRPGLSSKVLFEKFLKHRVNPQDVKASLADGILTITVPTDSQPADAVDIEIS